MLNRKLLHKFEKWCKFSSCVKAKLCQKKLCKMRPACKFKYVNSTFSERKSHTKCTVQDNVLCGVNSTLWLTGLIFAEGSIRIQWNLQQCRMRAFGHVGNRAWGHYIFSVFTHTHTHILCDVVGACVMINWFPESFTCRWLWPPCSLGMNCCYPLGLQLLCVTSTHIIFRSCMQKLKFLLRSSHVRLCATDFLWNWTYLFIICLFVPWKIINIL